MTRKEQIEQASIEYQLSTRPMAIGGDMFAEEARRMNINPSFVKGAEWSDQNPDFESFWNNHKNEVIKFFEDNNLAIYNKTILERSLKEDKRQWLNKAANFFDTYNLDYYQTSEGVFSRELIEDFRKYMEDK